MTGPDTVHDARSFVQFVRAIYFSDASSAQAFDSRNGPETAIEAMVACIEGNKFDIALPQNPWRAAAELMWMGYIYE